MPATTREEKTVNNRNRGVRTITVEEVGTNNIDVIAVPANARNIRRSLADGRAILQYDVIPEGVGDTFTISGTASQEPLATHPFFQAGAKWAVTDDEWKTWDKIQKGETTYELEGAKAGPPFSEGFQKFVQLYLKGFTDYLQPRVTIRVTDASSNSQPNLANLGKIATPTNAPDLDGGANWLLSGMDASEDADGKWEISREYISSGPGGWNADIYGP